ncbi:hypothetical protein V1L52_08380 [Treponema sp. HNW]|uniref:hypothetical protein n=1 Tax=Treponema sp. HNW TaxID=3116654 RepID=UPI003D11DA63
MCWKCGKKLEISSPVSRSALCPECGADVRCCRNCNFYEIGAHYDCRETIDKPVRDKERSSFCDWFSLNPNVSAFESGSLHPAAVSDCSKAQSAKNAFNALFGD